MFFSGSISGGLDDREVYLEIITLLGRYGEVISEHMIGDDGKATYASDGLTPQAAHDRDVDWILAADLLVADVSVPSIGVGYEVGRAVAAGVPVLALYRENASRPLSAMISGAPKSAIKTLHYDNVDLLEVQLANYFSA